FYELPSTQYEPSLMYSLITVVIASSSRHQATGSNRSVGAGETQSWTGASRNTCWNRISVRRVCQESVTSTTSCQPRVSASRRAHPQHDREHHQQRRGERDQAADPHQPARDAVVLAGQASFSRTLARIASRSPKPPSRYMEWTRSPSTRTS